MLFATAAVAKKRSLVAEGGSAAPTIEPLDARAQLRSLRVDAVGRYGPLLVMAAMLDALAILWAIRGYAPPTVLGGWWLSVGGVGWLAVRRVRGNMLLYRRRRVPCRVGIENGAILSLLAAFWAALPAWAYATLPAPMQTVVIGCVCTMLCGALAIAAAPAITLCWSTTIIAAFVAPAVAGAAHYPPAMTALIPPLLFLLAGVIARTGKLARDEARRLAAQLDDQTRIGQLIGNDDEQGTSLLWRTDARHILTHASPGIAALFGRPVSQLVGQALPALIGGSGALGAAMRAHTIFSGIELELGGDGPQRIVTFTGGPITDPNGRFTGFRGSCSDITETRRSENRLRELASLDVLTELPNRNRMRDLLADALSAARTRSAPCGILMLDLDGFKPVNDTFGHPKGDAVLKTVAERLVGAVAERGIVGRLGGDEFAIVLHHADNRAAVADLAERLIATVSEPYRLDGTSVRIGLSVGSAFGPIDGDTVDDLIKYADLALYEAKASGRGTHRHFEQTMQTEAENRLKLEQDLRQALALGQFRVFYQPLIQAHSQDVCGFEALIRWQHPTRGLVSPADFIPLAEEIGLIAEIGEWVLRTAVRDCARWPTPISVAVNLSPRQLESASLPAMISDSLARARLPANRLELEVTESVFMGDSAIALDVLRRLRALGVRIALDDFGTGYSSLGYLNRTIFNKLKIDGSFVRASATRPETVSIIQAIVTLANCFQMTILAEGIETQDDYRRMTALGCHEMQGYLFGRPVPFERAAEMARGSWTQTERQARG